MMTEFEFLGELVKT